MKRLLVCLLISVTAAASAAEQTLDRIVAVVNDEVVLASELQERLNSVRQRMQQRSDQMPPADELKRRVLEGLVTEQLQLTGLSAAGSASTQQAWMPPYGVLPDKMTCRCLSSAMRCAKKA